MHTTEQEQAIHVIGIELRTTNDEAMQTIPGHWQRFTNEGVADKVPGRQSQDVYAVYTNFENAGRSNKGLYSLVLGVPVTASTPVPDGMLRVVLPAARRAVFPVEAGRFDLVGAKWQEIWSRDDLAKTFIAEAERYRADGQIDILVGIEKEAPRA